MYVALKALKTSAGQRQAGDDLPEVNDWRPQVVQAHVNMKAIEWSGEGNPPHLGNKVAAPEKSFMKKGKKKKHRSHPEA